MVLERRVAVDGVDERADFRAHTALVGKSGVRKFVHHKPFEERDVEVVLFRKSMDGG
jgi:hypothetical protein